MRNKILFPHSFKMIVWILLIPSFILAIIFTIENSALELNATVFAFFSGSLFGKSKSFGFIEVNILPTIIGIGFIIGGLLVAFSKEKVEDEYISELRLSSLLWAVFVNYALLLLAFIFVYDMSFLMVMVYNMFTILIIFIIRFHFILYRTSKQTAIEK
jgi:FlaA1/EpsC-like NDP-sugar epimerase